MSDLEDLSAAYEVALAEYRADPTDEAKAAYKDAARALSTARQTSRAGRTGVGVVAEDVVEDLAESAEG